MVNEVKKIMAVKRMKILGLDPVVIKQFEEKNEISMSFGGTILPLSQVGMSAVETARSYGLYPYHIVVGYLPGIGVVHDILYVGDYMEDWASEVPQKYQEDDTYLAYILSYGTYTEFGSIVLQNLNGALIRCV